MNLEKQFKDIVDWEIIHNDVHPKKLIYIFSCLINHIVISYLRKEDH